MVYNQLVEVAVNSRMDEILDGWLARDGISWFYIFYTTLNALWGNNNNLAKGLFSSAFLTQQLRFVNQVLYVVHMPFPYYVII